MNWKEIWFVTESRSIEITTDTDTINEDMDVMATVGMDSMSMVWEGMDTIGTDTTAMVTTGMVTIGTIMEDTYGTKVPMEVITEDETAAAATVGNKWDSSFQWLPQCKY